jgi:hypothetical protein
MSDAARQILVLTKNADDPTSFTSVGNEADRVVHASQAVHLLISW